MKRISVLVVAWNQADLLSACLTAVHSAHPYAQVVVVDNGSSPPLTPHPNTVWIRSETNLGFAGGNNLGLPHCTGEYILLLNTDALLPSAAPLESLVDFLDKHPNVAVAQAKLVRSDGMLDTCGEFLTTCGVLYHHGYCQPDGPHAQAPFPIYAAKAACCLIRKTALDDIGGVFFRDEYFCYGEDLELCHRLWLAGHEVWFVPTQPVLHTEGASSQHLSNRIVWQHYLSNILTTARTLWSFKTWFHLGPGLLCLLIGGALLKGVLPRSKHIERICFTRKRTDKEMLKHTLVRVPWRYLIACIRRQFKQTIYPLPPYEKSPSKDE